MVASFQVADCPTSLVLKEDAANGTGSRKGKLSLTVRNTSAETRTARVMVDALDGAEASWFAIVGAPSTSPFLLERDFEARSTQTITVDVAVPAEAGAGVYGFRVKAVSETNPDEDFAEGPTVSLTVPELQAAPEPRRFPWWWVVAGSAAGLVVVVVAVLLLTSGAPELPDVIGDAPEVARQKLIDAGFQQADISEVVGSAEGADPGTVGRTNVANGGRRVELVVDPGVVVNAPVGTLLETVVTTLQAAGFETSVTGSVGPNPVFFALASSVPSDGTPAARGATVELVAATQPPLNEEVALTPGFRAFRFELPSGGSFNAAGTNTNNEAGCQGWIDAPPDYRFNYEAGNLTVEISALSKGTPSLVVRTPDGSWMCAASAATPTPNAAIVTLPAVSGVYDVWVGARDRGSFPVANLYVEEVVSGGVLGADRRPSAGLAYLTAGFQPTPYQANVVVGGSTQFIDNRPADQDTSCFGFLDNNPDFAVDYTAGSSDLTFRVLGATVDPLLIIRSPGGEWHCDDDSSGGLAPLLRFDSPASGYYTVWVPSVSSTEGMNVADRQASLEIAEIP